MKPLLFLILPLALTALDFIPLQAFQKFLALGKYDKYMKKVSLKGPLDPLRRPSRALSSEIKRVAAYNTISYCPRRKPEDIERMGMPTWQEIVYIETAQKLAGFLVALDHKARTVVVSFRGAMNKDQKLHTFYNGLVPYDLVHSEDPLDSPHVHYGCFWGYVSARKQLMAVTKRTMKQYPDYKLTITGYSYGGPLAVYAGVEFADLMEDARKVRVFTFGSVRPGDRGFAKLVNEVLPIYYRITTDADSLVHFPPPFRFMHPGREIYFKETVMKRPLVCEKGVGEDRRCALSHTKWTNIDDHYTYWKRVKCQAGEEWGDVDLAKDKSRMIEEADAYAELVRKELNRMLFLEKVYKKFGVLKIPGLE